MARVGWRRLLALGGMALGIGALVPQGPAAAKVTWDYYLITGITHPVSQNLKAFADEVRKRTDGELDIVVRPAGELPFRATEALRIAGQGQVQMASGYAGFLSGSVPVAAIAGNPFLVRTYDDLKKVWPIIDKYTAPEFEKAGAKTLFWWAWPEQNLYGRGEPIKALEDFKGRKFRVTDPKQAAMIEDFGASTVSLTTAEVPVAMERGLMEGVFTAAFNAVGAKWYEFLDWAWLPDIHIGGPNYEFVNIEAYNALPENLRKTLDEVAAEWGPKTLDKFEAMEAGDRKTLEEEHGLTMFVPPEDQVAAATKLMEPNWEAWAEEHNAQDALKEIREALGR